MASNLKITHPPDITDRSVVMLDTTVLTRLTTTMLNAFTKLVHASGKRWNADERVRAFDDYVAERAAHTAYVRKLEGMVSAAVAQGYTSDPAAAASGARAMSPGDDYRISMLGRQLAELEIAMSEDRQGSLDRIEVIRRNVEDLDEKRTISLNGLSSSINVQLRDLNDAVAGLRGTLSGGDGVIGVADRVAALEESIAPMHDELSNRISDVVAKLGIVSGRLLRMEHIFTGAARQIEPLNDVPGAFDADPKLNDALDTLAYDPRVRKAELHIADAVEDATGQSDSAKAETAGPRMHSEMRMGGELITDDEPSTPTIGSGTAEDPWRSPGVPIPDGDFGDGDGHRGAQYRGEIVED